MRMEFSDKEPDFNFIILNDGNVYEGNGFDLPKLKIPTNYSRSILDVIGIYVAFCGNNAGNYSEHFKTLNNFLRESWFKNDLDENYLIFAKDQLSGNDESLGFFPDTIKKLERFYDCKLKLYAIDI